MKNLSVNEQNGQQGVPEEKPSGTTPIKKNTSQANAAAKQKGSKQISIRGIPLVRSIYSKYFILFRLF